MKAAVLSLALLFSILLCLPAQSQADTDGSGMICAGHVGGIGDGKSGMVAGMGACIRKPKGFPRAQRAEVQLLRD